MKQRYSRQSQKLIMWMISDYANYQDGKNAGSKASSYSLYKAKKELKKAFLKHTGYKDSYKSVKELREDIRALFQECIDQEPNTESIADLFTDIIMEVIADFIQNLMMSLDGTFSFALYLMSQKQANEFIDWLFEYMIDNDIPFRQQISELYQEQNNNKYIWNCIMNRVCCISGEKGADLHHCISVNQVGGYDKDTGLTIPFLSLSRKYHNLVHSIGKELFEEKFKVKGILLTEKDIIKLKEKGFYKNQFKAFKGDEINGGNS